MQGGAHMPDHQDGWSWVQIIPKLAPSWLPNPRKINVKKQLDFHGGTDINQLEIVFLYSVDTCTDVYLFLSRSLIIGKLSDGCHRLKHLLKDGWNDCCFALFRVFLVFLKSAYYILKEKILYSYRNNVVFSR